MSSFSFLFEEDIFVFIFSLPFNIDALCMVHAV